MTLVILCVASHLCLNSNHCVPGSSRLPLEATGLWFQTWAPVMCGAGADSFLILELNVVAAPCREDCPEGYI